MQVPRRRTDGQAQHQAPGALQELPLSGAELVARQFSINGSQRFGAESERGPLAQVAVDGRVRKPAISAAVP